MRNLLFEGRVSFGRFPRPELQSVTQLLLHQESSPASKSFSPFSLVRTSILLAVIF